MNSLRAESLSFFRGRRSIVADISIVIEPGSVTTILGPNGSGKSTILRLLTGEWTPRSGKIVLGNRPLAGWEPEELARVRAVLPQESSLAFAFSVFEVVLLGRLPFHGGRESLHDREVCRIALERVEAGHLADRYYTELSSGEKQRVQLARVLAQAAGEVRDQTGFGFLFLDEPTNHLDLSHRHATLRLAREEARKGRGVFAVLHDINLARLYADYTYLLKEGNLVAEGPAREILIPQRIAALFNVRAAEAELSSAHPYPGDGKFLATFPRED